MAKLLYKHGVASAILRVKILDSSSTTGAGLTGLAFGDSGLIISTIADVEATVTVYTSAGSTIEDITTLGTYAAPTATKCRFKEVDATNHPGLYEIQLADARFSVTNARSLIVSVHGATNAALVDAEVQLTAFDLNTNSIGSVDGHTAQTGDSFARLGAPAGASVSADIAVIKTATDDMKGATFVTGTDSLEAIRNRGDAAWTGSGGGGSSAADIWNFVLEPSTTEAIKSTDFTAGEIMKIMLAGVGGRTSNGGRNFSTPNGAVSRIEATIAGNDRTGMIMKV